MNQRHSLLVKEASRHTTFNGHVVKPGLDWTCKTWTGLICKTWTGLRTIQFVKPGLDSFVKHGLDSFVKHGLDSFVKHGLDSFVKHGLVFSSIDEYIDIFGML